MTPLDLVGMFALGLLGSAHCVAMCSAFAVCVSARRSTNTLWYQLGRWLSYVVLGALMGTLGVTARLAWDHGAGRVLLLVASGLMIVMGLALAGVLPHLAPRGSWLASRLRPLLTSPSPKSALGVGTLTGLLPCGLLYAALARAAASGHPWSGALLMAAFWMGTTPLLAAGSQLLPRWGRSPWWPRLAGTLVLLLGLTTAVRAWPTATPSDSVCPMCQTVGNGSDLPNAR